MQNTVNKNHSKQMLIVYVALTIVTLAVFWQVHQYDFLIIDDNHYVTGNSYVQAGFTLEGFRGAFSFKSLFWDPLTFISLMLDYEFYGLNAGGYHITNLILHLLSTLLLFWLLSRMTHSIWRSAFVAGLFALHPLHVQSVAWIAERRDVLCGFFWMLTLCFYVYYSENPSVKRYLPVLFSFILALLSKAMAVTLPIVLLLLDYWPLGRLQSDKHPLSKTKMAGIIPWWQVKEKLPFIMLSALFVVITLIFPYLPSAKGIDRESFPLISLLANAPVSFVTYLRKTFWPHDLSILYPFSDQPSLWLVLGSVLLILIITAAVIATVKRLPYIFAGWFWYAITILPVIGIVQIGNEVMADRYTYLPSAGIYIMLTWGVPVLFSQNALGKKILFSAGIAFLAILAVLTWNECRYWKNSVTLFSHALQVNKDNYLASDCLGIAMFVEGRNQEAIDCYTKTIILKPGFTGGYIGRGLVYSRIGQPRLAIKDYDEAIRLDSRYADAYHNRGVAYNKLGQYQLAIEDYNKAIGLQPSFLEAYNSRGIIYYKLGHYNLAIEDFNKAVSLNPDLAEVFNNRSFAHFKLGNNELGLKDARNACKLGMCVALEWAKGHGLYR
jgi:tetratricopeptide (TPR) repeat protein